MKLHTGELQLFDGETLEGAVVEIAVRHRGVGRQRALVDDESVVLRGDRDASRA